MRVSWVISVIIVIRVSVIMFVRITRGARVICIIKIIWVIRGTRVFIVFQVIRVTRVFILCACKCVYMHARIGNVYISVYIYVCMFVSVELSRYWWKRRVCIFARESRRYKRFFEPPYVGFFSIS